MHYTCNINISTINKINMITAKCFLKPFVDLLPCGGTHFNDYSLSQLKLAETSSVSVNRGKKVYPHLHWLTTKSSYSLK